jgi:hypothetical protein
LNTLAVVVIEPPDGRYHQYIPRRLAERLADIVVSFVMESGLDRIFEHLKDLLARGVRGVNYFCRSTTTISAGEGLAKEHRWRPQRNSVIVAGRSRLCERCLSSS